MRRAISLRSPSLVEKAGQLQIAFAGHVGSSDIGDIDRVAGALATALALLGEAGVTQATLITGLAEGADQLAAKEWRKASMGAVHAVYPVLIPADASPAPPAETPDFMTSLDGDAGLVAGLNPYLEQTRWIVGVADLLIVVWNGRPARGPGGTADAVKLALEGGVPVLWVRPGQLTVNLIDPGRLSADFAFQNLLEQTGKSVSPLYQKASATQLTGLLHLDRQLDWAGIIGADAEVNHAVDEWLHGWLWRTYAAFFRILGGRSKGRNPMPVPPTLAEQDGFKWLTGIYEELDSRAQHLSATHRSEQVLLIGAALLATIIGSLTAIWHDFKFAAVLIELALALGAFLVWLGGSRSRRHARWSTARYLAEILRAARANWAVGLQPVRITTATEPNQVKLLAQAIVRSAGLPEGAFDASRTNTWGAWALDQTIHDQAAYHHAQALGNEHAARHLSILEHTVFVLLVGAMVSYILFRAFIDAPEWVDFASGLVTVVGIVMPAIGAASMALDAKLGFEEQAQRSDDLARRLDELDTREAQTLVDVRRLVRRATYWLMLEAGQWSDGTVRRRLYRGG